MILPTLPILNMANSALEKTNERWFVLEPPRDMKGTASSAVPDVSEVKANRHTEQQQLSEVEEEEIIVEVSEGLVMLQFPRASARISSRLLGSMSRILQLLCNIKISRLCVSATSWNDSLQVARWYTVQQTQDSYAML